jgi:hypothetical protein
MNDDQGALSKIEHGEFSAAFHDLVVSAENLVGVATTDAEQLLAAGLKTLAADAKTDLGQIVTTTVGAAIAAAGSGQTPPQILATVLPQLEQTIVNDAKAAGQDVEQTVLNTARVMLVGATQAGNASSSAAAPATSDSSTTNS